MFNFLKRMRVFLTIFLVLLALPNSLTFATNATGEGIFEGVFCNVYLVSKNIVKPMLIILIAVLAVLSFLGKIQLATLLMLGAGIAIFFGAPFMVQKISGGGQLCTGYVIIPTEASTAPPAAAQS